MTGKQKRYLRALASTMPAIVQIGKEGLTEAVVDSADRAITARELIKIKVLNNSPEEAKLVFASLGEAIGAELVQVIGHNGVLYKAKAEPKIILP